MRALYALVVPVLLASSGFVTAGYIDDNTTFSRAISVLRSAVGPHARALRMEAMASKSRKTHTIAVTSTVGATEPLLTWACHYGA